MITARKSNDDLLRPLSNIFNAALSVGCIALLFSVLPVFAQQPPRPQRKGDKTAAKSIPTTQAEVARGKYIVENVAMCPQCHTARNGDGSLDHARELEGAPEFFQPPYPDANWPLKAPRIGGNPPANDQDMIKLLTTGIWTDGKPLRLPMMPFRMSDADAKAVLAYLKSVKQQH
jgi:mono/diheme cytochrome c family protein